jgi:hypothetical protein
MKQLFAAALFASAAFVHAQTTPAAASAPAVPVSAAKKELIAKLLTLQQPVYENMAREIVMRPAVQLGQQAGRALQNLPPEKRESTGKGIDTDIRKFIDESTPLLRDRAIKAAPTTLGPILEEKMSEDELKQLVAWLDSPAAKKYQQLGAEMQQAMLQKLMAEAGPMLTPKLQALETKVAGSLGIPPAAPAGSAPPAKAPVPKKAASK